RLRPHPLLVGDATGLLLEEPDARGPAEAELARARDEVRDERGPARREPGRVVRGVPVVRVAAVRDGVPGVVHALVERRPVAPSDAAEAERGRAREALRGSGVAVLEQRGRRDDLV